MPNLTNGAIANFWDSWHVAAHLREFGRSIVEYHSDSGEFTEQIDNGIRVAEGLLHPYANAVRTGLEIEPLSTRNQATGSADRDTTVAAVQAASPRELSAEELKHQRAGMLAEAQQRWARPGEKGIHFAWIHKKAKVHHRNATDWKSGKMKPTSIMATRIEDVLKSEAPPRDPKLK